MPKLNEDDLAKGLDALKAAANLNNPHARRAELFAKAQSGAISAEENDELVKSLSGSQLVDTVTDTLRSNDTIQKSLDVSDFLREQHKGVVDGLTALTEHLQKSQSDDQGFRVALATTLTSLADTVVQQSQLMKSMSEKMGVALSQPARGPKSVGVNAAPMQKSFAGQVAPAGSVQTDGTELSKSQILDVMEEMNKSESGMAPSGENLTFAITKYESTNQISPALLRDVATFVAKSNRAA
jgi:hypothetical protein